MLCTLQACRQLQQSLMHREGGLTLDMARHPQAAQKVLSWMPRARLPRFRTRQMSPSRSPAQATAARALMATRPPLQEGQGGSIAIYAAQTLNCNSTAINVIIVGA